MSLENLNDFFGLGIIPKFSEIPAPQQPIIDLNKVSPEMQLSHAVWHTYNPVTETVALKSSPENSIGFVPTIR